MSPRAWRDLGKVLLLAAVYVVVAKLGLRFATVTRSVTLFWPSSGVSLAALVWLGRGAWPGVALGAFVANLWTPGVGPLVAGAIAAGNTLEAVIGARLLERARFDKRLGSISDVVALVALGGVVSTMASATIGVSALVGSGLLDPGGAPSAWRVWWLGDLMGDLVFTPLCLALGAWPAASALARARRIELATLAALLAFVALSAFGLVELPRSGDFPQPYTIFPLLVWAALRFGPGGAAAANFVVSATSVAATVRGVGPFARSSLNESLFQLQTFMAAAVLTSLLLGAAVAERDRAITTRDDFLALASHELKTPLTALHLDVVSLARMLRKVPDAPPRILHRVEHTEQQLDRLRDLVLRLLDSSQIGAGHLTLNLSELDLAALAREVVGRAGGAIELDAPAAVVGRWDQARLEVLLTNLISNAVKYGDGKPVEVSVLASPTVAVLRVRDHGIGIGEEHQARVFRRFERAVSSKRYPGLGLGLWIVKEIVDAMHGRIELESRPGEGATFTVTLPRDDGAPS
jgi:signal transduction histidine kinase